MDAGMGSKPLSDRATRVTGEIVVDEVEVACGIRGIDGLYEFEEAGRIAGRGGEGECLPIRGP